MNIRRLNKVLKTMLSNPNEALLLCNVEELTNKYDLPIGDRIFWIKGTKKGLRLCKDRNRYTIMVIDEFGDLSRGIPRYSEDFYGAYAGEDTALRKCIELVREFS